MSSSQWYEKCSECGGVCFCEMNCKTGEFYVSCQSCGRHYDEDAIIEKRLNPESDTPFNFVKDAFGQLIVIFSNFPARGSYSFVGNKGVSTVGAIVGDLTPENYREHFVFNDDNQLMGKDGEPADIDMERSHITFYDAETKTFNTVWGTRPVDELEDYLTDADTFDWEQITLPVGQILSSNCPADIATKLELPVSEKED